MLHLYKYMVVHIFVIVHGLTGNKGILMGFMTCVIAVPCNSKGIRDDMHVFVMTCMCLWYVFLMMFF